MNGWIGSKKNEMVTIFGYNYASFWWLKLVPFFCSSYRDDNKILLRILVALNAVLESEFAKYSLAINK